MNDSWRQKYSTSIFVPICIYYDEINIFFMYTIYSRVSASWLALPWKHYMILCNCCLAVLKGAAASTSRLHYKLSSYSKEWRTDWLPDCSAPSVTFFQWPHMFLSKFFCWFTLCQSIGCSDSRVFSRFEVATIRMNDVEEKWNSVPEGRGTWHLSSIGAGGHIGRKVLCRNICKRLHTFIILLCQAVGRGGCWRW